jgi:glucan-binding YG repeat protein
MLKRITKVASLLFLASIVSIGPAYADNANADNVKKIDSTDGTIYSASGSGNAYYIDGDIDGKGEGVYWVTADGTFHPLDVPIGLGFSTLLYNRYMEFNDLGTYVDTQNNYSVIKDTLRTTLEDDAQEALKKKIRNDDNGRFLKSDYTNNGLGIEAVNKTNDGVAVNKFLANDTGTAMYPYHLAIPFSDGGANKFTDMIYSDYKGNYVDADYNLGSLKVGTTDSSVTIKNTGNTYELKDGNKTYELRAVISNTANTSYASNSVTYKTPYISYIMPDYYRWADISIYAKEKGEDDSAYTNVTDKYVFGGKYKAASGSNSITVLQKFSSIPAKDTIGGIKYSKSSTIYFVADEDGKVEYPIGINKSFGVRTLNAKYGLNLTGSTSASTMLITGQQGWTNVYLNKSNSMLYAQRLKLKSEGSFNYMQLDNLASEKISNTSLQKASGSLYFLSNGYVETYDGKGFAKLYKVDGSMTKFYVGALNSMLAYDPDGTRYVMIHSQVTTTEPAATAIGTWSQAKDGSWTFKKDDGTGNGHDDGIYVNSPAGAWYYDKDTGIWTFKKADKTAGDIQEDNGKASGWLQDSNGKWSYGNSDGTKASGWLKDGDKWYYLDDLGIMQTGWIQDDGKWYYLSQSGAMVSNTQIDGYTLGEDGAWINN